MQVSPPARSDSGGSARGAVWPWLALSGLSVLLGLSLFAMPAALLSLAARCGAGFALLRGEDRRAHTRLGLALVLDGAALLAWGFALFEAAAWSTLAPGLLGHAALWMAWIRVGQRVGAARLAWGLQVARQWQQRADHDHAPWRRPDPTPPRGDSSSGGRPS